MNLVKKVIKKIFNVIKKIVYFINDFRFYRDKVDATINQENKLNDIIDERVKFKEVNTLNLNCRNDEFKWVGAVNYNNYMYCITNTVNKVLKVNLENDKVDYLEFKSDSSNEFKWTGGCYYKNRIYGFPRASNKLLCINPDNDEVTTIDINLNYKSEHHYSGVCTNDGIVYQPPRGNNTILAIDLNTFKSHEIKIAPKFLKYRYLTGIQHTNGLIYFFPERNERVMVLNPQNEKVYMIGKKLNCMVFDVAIGKDDNIYGFSGYEKGILKINTKTSKTEMICQEIGIPGCYGSKLAGNGKIYGIPGNGNYVWEFDVKTQNANKVFKVSDEGKAKCAGGIITKDGTIYTVPALGNKIYKIEFDRRMDLSDEQLNSIYFSDSY